jgi:hypothetical protein
MPLWGCLTFLGLVQLQSDWRKMTHRVILVEMKSSLVSHKNNKLVLKFLSQLKRLVYPYLADGYSNQFLNSGNAANEKSV